MNSIVKLKRFLLFLGDVAALYASLFLMLLIRYGQVSRGIVYFHLYPFSFLFLIWVIVFYIGDLYDLRVVKDTVDSGKRFGNLLLANGLIAILFFYFIPGLAITPKINLFVFLGIVAVIDYYWRRFYARSVTVKLPVNRLLFIGYNETLRELAAYIDAHPQLGYEIKHWMREGLRDDGFTHLADLISKHRITTIVVPAHIKKNPRAAKLIYKNLIAGVEVVDLSELYAALFKKVPLAELEEVWFLEHLTKSHRLYEAVKRPVEVALVTAVLFVTLPLTLLASFLIRLTSKGSALFSQRRVGRKGALFSIYKLRTMRADAEHQGPQWASKNDARTIPVGRFLRRTHLDEFPQLWNVLHGELSLIGPRPERPEFVASLKKEIPYYELRHLIRPGITGWAQTHYRYGASVEDAYEKLQYDIYYLKHRSAFLDILILLKTIKFFFTNL